MGWDVNCEATATCDACGKKETYPVFDKHGTHFPYPDIEFFQEYGWDMNEGEEFLCSNCLASGNSSSADASADSKRAIFDRVTDGSRHGKGTRRQLLTIQEKIKASGVPCKLVAGAVRFVVAGEKSELFPLDPLGRRIDEAKGTEVVDWMELVGPGSKSLLPRITLVLQRLGYQFRASIEEAS